jgi:hypothetical protein
MTGQRGIALILAMLVTSFLAAIGLGLAVVVFANQLAAGNVRGATGLMNAAEAGLEVTAHELSRADWSRVLGGAEQATFSDGSPDGVRAIPGGGVVNLSAETNSLNCGTVTECTVAQMNMSSEDRPWGANNPRWRLYAYGALDVLPLMRPTPCYLAVWVADDVAEVDGEPLVDGETEGRGVLRARSVAFGPLGARRAVEAELARVCFGVAGSEICQPGIRVQSWQEVRQLVP